MKVPMFGLGYAGTVAAMDQPDVSMVCAATQSAVRNAADLRTFAGQQSAVQV